MAKYRVVATAPISSLGGKIIFYSDSEVSIILSRLGIKYKTKDGQVRFVHTLNGTACAIPRLLIALTENEQCDKGTICIPQVLQRFMRGKSTIGRQKKVPELKLVKNKKQ